MNYSHLKEELYDNISSKIEQLIMFIALLTNNTGFGPGFSYRDWQNSSHDQSNLACLKIGIVGLSFADLEMAKQFT